MVVSCMVEGKASEIAAAAPRDAFLLRIRMDNYMTIKEAAEKWGVSIRRVQKLCEENKVPGLTKFGRSWAIPRSALKPADGRVTTGQYRNWRKDRSNDA